MPVAGPCRLCLRGPLTLHSAEGRCCTPAGGVRKALLALLVLSDTGSRGRSRLQSLLWEAAPPEQAASNLRTALSVLRKELRTGLGFDPITADAQTVSIELAAFRVDVLDEAWTGTDHDDDASLDLLEGLDLRTAGGEDFEDWLRAERSRRRPSARRGVPGLVTASPGTRIDRRVESAHASATVVDPVAFSAPLFDASTGGRAAIGLLPVHAGGDDPLAPLLAEAVQDVIADGLQALGGVIVHDYRRADAPPTGEWHALGPQLLLSGSVRSRDGRCVMQFRTHQRDSRTLLGGDTVACDCGSGMVHEDATLVAFVAQSVDRLLAWYDAAETSGVRATATPFHFLDGMFRSRGNELDALDLALAEVATGREAPVYDALRAYLQTFRVGEHWGRYEADVNERSRELIAGLMRSNSSDGIALFAAGHVLGYTLHEHELAHDMLTSAVERCPSLAICWDHLALNYLYLGEYEEARRAVDKALALSTFSPLRFTVETTACMVATLQGDYERAVRMGRRALARKPDFGAALRYLTISLSHLGRHEQAAGHRASLLAMDPEFSSAWIDAGRFALTDEAAKERLRSGLRLIGID